MQRSAALVLVLACAASAAAQRPRAQAQVDWSVLEPQATKRVEPVCPLNEALPPGVPGRVIVRTIIGTDGKVRKAEAYAGEKRMSGPAADALAKWEFVPQTVNGEPVEVRTMAVIKVCDEPEQPLLDDNLVQIKRLSDECRDEANVNAEASCLGAQQLADGMTGELAMLGRWWAYAALGEFYAAHGRIEDSDKTFSDALAWFRKQPLSGAMQLDFLWHLGELRAAIGEYERALQAYREAETLMQGIMDDFERQDRANLPGASAQEIHAAQVRNMKRALEGEVRCLTALKRDGEADALRVRIAQLK
jgi:tetratricopeptide (TPR) repeat protein